MTAFPHSRVLWATLCLALALFLSAGCKKQRANLNIKKLDDIVNEANVHNGPQFSKTKYDDVVKQLDGVKKLYADQQWAQAFDSSRAAVRSAEEMLTEVKTNRAAYLQQQVQKDVLVARDNGGDKDDAKAYQDILDNQRKGEEKRAKIKMDEAIKYFLEASGGVDRLLAPQKAAATERLASVKALAQTMKTEEVDKYAQPQEIEANKTIKTADDLIVLQRQYKTGQTVLSQAEQSIKRAIERAKEVRSQIIINEIEQDVSVAMEKGAEFDFRDRLIKNLEAYAAVLAYFSDKKYDECLKAGELLRAPVKKLRFDSAKAAADHKIKTLESHIKELVDGGAREYLPGSVELLEEKHTDALGQLKQDTEDAFGKSEKICEAAIGEYDEILKDFNGLASQSITDANKELDLATEVFKATEHIFDIPASPVSGMTKLEEQMESNKRAMKAGIQGLINTAVKTLSLSQLQRDRQKYRDSILSAEAVKDAALLVQEKTYSVAAHNAILEIQARLAHYDTQGGRQYAPLAVDETQRLLNEARDLLQKNKPKDSVDKAALAKAQLDNLRQEMSALGGKKLMAAQTAIAQATDDKASDLASERLNEARNAVEGALAARDQNDYKDLIELSEKAAHAAKSAQTESQRKQAEQQLADAQAKLALADKAEASIYAPRQYKEAADKMAAASKMMEEMKYKEAASPAGKAAQEGGDAAYERVIAAEKEIATAKSYKAWDYDPRKTADAINAAKEARRLTDEGSFDAARGRGDEAKRLAEEAASEAKLDNVVERVKALREGVDKSISGGSSYFQASEVKSLTDQISALEEKYIETAESRPPKAVTNYEESAKKLKELEARLEEVLVSTPAVLERAVAEQKARREHYLKSRVDIATIAEQEIDDSDKCLRYAEIDFGQGKYRHAYLYLRRATRELDVVEQLLASSDYNEKTGELFAEFQKALEDFNHILSLGESALTQLAVNTATNRAQAIAISGPSSPIAFRLKIDSLYERARLLTPPACKKTTHASVLLLFKAAMRAAANFEKLTILDQYDKKTARAVLHNGFEQIDAAKKGQHMIEKTFHEPGTDSLIVAMRKAIGSALY